MQPRRVVHLIEDDLVGGAPVELQRHARERDRASVGNRTAPRVRARVTLGRAADLATRPLLQALPVRNPREVAITAREVGRRVEGGGACQEPVVSRHEEERLLAAHAATHRVDGMRPHAQPRKGRLRDVLHVREVADLALPAPRMERQPTAVPLWADHGEATACRQVAPEGQVRPPRETATVRGDHERQRRVVVRPDIGRKRDVRGARETIVRAVANRPDAHLVTERHGPDRRCRRGSRHPPGRRAGYSSSRRS